MDTQTNPTDAPRLKKPMSRALFIVIYEVGVALGCVLALFLVPPTTPLKTFLWICAGLCVGANVLLVIGLRRQSKRQPGEQRITQRNRYLTWLPIVFVWFWILWKLYERFGR